MKRAMIAYHKVLCAIEYLHTKKQWVSHSNYPRWNIKRLTFSEKNKIWNGKRRLLFQIFLFPLSRETRSNIFLKNSPTPRGNQLLWAYFLYSHHGMSDQNRWHSRKASKIKAFSGFWGRFSKPQKIQFYRWHSVFEVKKRFSGSEMIEKISLLFFVSELKYDCKGVMSIGIWNKVRRLKRKINQM